MGGLGNQMFQYALGYTLAKKNNVDLKVDLTLLMDRSKHHEIVTHRTLLLNKVFDINILLATEEEINYFNGKNYGNLIGKIYNRIRQYIIKNKLKIQNNRAFDSSFLEVKKNTCIVGSFQSELYFIQNSDEIKKIFKFKQELLPISIDLGEQMKLSDSVGIHIRRGDYVSSPVYSEIIGVLPNDYYKNAIELIKKRVSTPSFFIFSDDINWCKENFKDFQSDFYYVEDEHAGIDAANYLQLMTLCKHYIISNSTYAWWGAWLSSNENKIVIAPAKWFNKTEYNNNDIVPTNWIKI